MNRYDVLDQILCGVQIGLFYASWEIGGGAGWAFGTFFGYQSKYYGVGLAQTHTHSDLCEGLWAMYDAGRLFSWQHMADATILGLNDVRAFKWNYWKCHNMWDEWIEKDPVVLDLDGDGISSCGVLEGNAYFDHDGNGFAEQTGWIASNDGLLAMDRNGDGVINDDGELFSDQTILQSGFMATSGFEALAELDSNQDDKIDAADPAFEQLIVWTDANGDGQSSPEELFGLYEIGIESISLDSTTVNETDDNGNTVRKLGSFEWTDGTTGQIAEYSFAVNDGTTVPTSRPAVPDDFWDLPYLPGLGNVPDLYHAMLNDESGVLKTLVELFTEATGVVVRNSLMEQILLKWTGTEEIDPASRGESVDALHVAVVQKFYGSAVSTLVPAAENVPPSGIDSVQVEELYRSLFEQMYSALMLDPRILIKHFPEIHVKVDAETEEILALDFGNAIAEVQSRMTIDPEGTKELVSEFGRIVRGGGLWKQDYVDYMSLREAFIEIDPDLGWYFDTGGLPVRMGVGTNESEALRGYSDDDIPTVPWGKSWIRGYSGDDVIYGSDRSETLSQDIAIGPSGNGIFVAGAGDDAIYAFYGDDLLDGGEGDDHLYGEIGNDTYIYRRGSGHDVIYDWDSNPDNVDTIWFGGHLAPEDVTVERVGRNLVFRIVDSPDDSLTVKDYFQYGSAYVSGHTRVERIEFMDGTVWTDSDIILDAYTPTDGDDTIYGGQGDDDLSGGAGDDTIYAKPGNDILDGGADNDRIYGDEGDDILDGGSGTDWLYGGAGNDTYRFGRGSGEDLIYELDSTQGNIDTIELGSGIAPEDVKLETAGEGWTLTILDTNEAITSYYWLDGRTPIYGVDAIRFADGTEWGLDEIQDILVQSTDGNDSIQGFSRGETIEGGAGDDKIFGWGGDDTLNGGIGGDSIYGDAGSDIITGGEGNDTIYGGSEGDTLFGGDV